MMLLTLLQTTTLLVCSSRLIFAATDTDNTDAKNSVNPPTHTYPEDTTPTHRCSRDSVGTGEHCHLSSQTGPVLESEDGSSYTEGSIRDQDDGPVFYEDRDEELFMWEPIENGYERQVEVLDKNYTIRTMSTMPKLFVIPNFLTDEECDHMINEGKKIGLVNRDVVVRNVSWEYEEDRDGKFEQWDQNEDGFIDYEDILKHCGKVFILFINQTLLVDHVLPSANLPAGVFDDGKLSREEFASIDTVALSEVLRDVRNKHPHHMDRFANNVWLEGDVLATPVFTAVRERVAKLTRMPDYIVEGSEPLQVVHYEPHGHYHGHYDGQDKVAPCCYQVAETAEAVKLAKTKKGHCKLCRYITLTFNLNDVEEGGETAFPVADDPKYSWKKLEEEDRYKTNLSQFCKGERAPTSTAVKPARGSAILWYNHHRDSAGWLGQLDYNSLHGGCDVVKGEKWIGINWITAPPYTKKHLKSHYKNGVISNDYSDRGNDNYFEIGRD